MKITIHRGSHQIGGSCTEYEHEGWHLFVDYGAPLPGTSSTEKIGTIEGLNSGNLSKSALLITHYHGDHIGMIGELPSELQVYMGDTCLNIQTKFAERMSMAKKVDESERYQRILTKLAGAHTFQAKQDFEWGPFRIRPIPMDHSAFDAYGFYIQTQETTVFHTGDFRLTGNQDSTLEDLSTLGHVDYLVCEATNIHRNKDAQLPETEDELQQEFTRLFRENEFNVVYVASTNITRLFGLYQAAIQTGRVFLVDKYQKTIMDIINNNKTIAPFYRYNKSHKPTELVPNFVVEPKFRKLLTNKGYVLIARAAPNFDKLKKKIPGSQTTYLSMWQGYMQPGPAANTALQKSIVGPYLYKHVSGHCRITDLKNVIAVLHPNIIIPMHTDDPEQVRVELGEKVQVLQDGEELPLTNGQQ